MDELPPVSIIIPCRNEEKFIATCLDSIIANDYAKDKLEVLVVDGMSEDGVRDIIRQYTKQYPFIRLLDNPKKITPCALNIGIKNASGEIIMRMDAHNTYDKEYVSKCIKYLKERNADNVGGAIRTVSRDGTFIGKAIALVLSHRFGVGNSVFRTGSKEPKCVDTVFGGCYKKEVFERIGLFNENLARGQDMEFNLRLKKAGLKTLLVPEIVSYYYARSGLKSFCRHNFVNGVGLIYPPLKFGIVIFSWRHLAPLAFVSSLIGSALLSFFSPIFLRLFLVIFSLYLSINIYFSIKSAIRERNIKYLFIMPIIFSTLHISYGLGSLLGIKKLLIKPKINIHAN
jgi:glycosyltransferase involved in cell wall biosynthesis